MKDEIYRLCGLLEVKPDASDQELKQAHRDLAKVWHPDRFPEDERLRRKAEDKIKIINAAYETLLSMGEELRAESIRPRAGTPRPARPASSPLRTPPPGSSTPTEEPAFSQAASPSPDPASATPSPAKRAPLPPYVKPLVLVALCGVLVWMWPRSSSEPPSAPPPPAVQSPARAHDAATAMVKATEEKPSAPLPAITLPEATLKSRAAPPTKDLPECKNGDDVPFAHRLSNGAFAHTHPSCWRVSQYSADELQGFLKTASLQYEIPEALLRAIIAVSQKLAEADETTAQGLMQLTAPVAKEMLVRDPLDARQSIDGGARFLRILANQYEGNMEKILALYRAGHPSTEKVEIETLLQESSTQTFVKNVIRVYFDLKQSEEAK